MITINNVSHKIGANDILTNVTAEIPANGITAIVGPNGAGKSTLLNLIGRQTTLNDGDIQIDGSSLHSTSTDKLALKIALVAQDVGVASRIKIKELIAFGRWPHSKGRLNDFDKEIVEAAMERFDLVDLKDRFLDQLSGGQRQRAFIAMAFAQETDWLLLDEPLNNLDMFHARALMNELKLLAVENQKSIVMVIHDVNYAARWSDYCIGLDFGKIKFAGATQDVLTAKSVEQLFQVNVSVLGSPNGIILDHY
ncbi:MAG: ATP-binding cassette domain-containing protein [Rhizobiaceae bacterium]|nr:ATP-binding cassette domain-containing protein [Rhizobiaceae bacterium]